MKQITATDYYNFDKCRYRPYLDFNGDSQRKEPVHGLVELLWQSGAQHEEKIIELFKKKYPGQVEDIAPDRPTSPALFETTIEAMKRGVPFIYQGVLIFENKTGRPDLLVKQTGASKLGDYHYRPMDIKASFKDDEWDDGTEKQKLSYHWQLYFYAELLAHLQGVHPTSGTIFKTEKRISEYDLRREPRGYAEARVAMKSYFEGKALSYEPEIGGKCGQCPWKTYCADWAEEHDDLTRIFWLGGKFKYGLYQMGIRTVSDLAKADAQKLKAQLQPLKDRGFFWKTLSPHKIDEVIKRAKIRLSGQPQIYRKPDFPKATREIHYDVEDDPTQDFVYLHGFWIVEEGKMPMYGAFFADSKDQEKEVTRQLFDFLNTQKGVPIYHYSGHEKTILKYLSEKYPQFNASFLDFMFGPEGTAIDLYAWVERNTDWPLTSYGLKSICKYLGFDWSAEDAGGANSIVWLDEFLKGDEAKKEKILLYNQEDCQATWFLKTKLSEMRS